MTNLFAPPVVNDVPPALLPEEPDMGDRLMRFFRARPSGVNVYMYAIGSPTEVYLSGLTPPQLRTTEVDPITLYDTHAVPISNGWEDLERVFWGGCAPTEVTDSQAQALTDAGYIVTVI